MPQGIGYGPSLGASGGLAAEPLQTSTRAQQERQVDVEQQQAAQQQTIEEEPVSETLGQNINTLA